MKKIAFILTIILLQTNVERAQSPQLALVRPDGTTYICPTFDSAYNKAVNGDFIYMPGGNFIASNPITKRLYIYGAGYNQDSSAATGITTLGNIIILQGGDNGTIEGLQISNSNCNTGCIRFGNDLNSSPIIGYTISNCYLVGGVQFTSPSTNIVIKNNLIGGYNCNNGGSRTSIGGFIANSLISNNIVTGSLSISGEPMLQVNNNIFFYAATFDYLGLASNSTYQNNVFQIYSTSYVTNTNFNNNFNGSPNGSGNINIGGLFGSWDSTFISPGQANQYGWYSFDIHNNYHLKASSICRNYGTDGTDIGIYGGAFPWKDGSIPSNPHIYFKQIAPQTNSSAELQIQFKVRTNN